MKKRNEFHVHPFTGILFGALIVRPWRTKALPKARVMHVHVWNIISPRGRLMKANFILN